AAAEFEVPFLGEIPLDMAIREGSDTARPVMVSAPDGPFAAAYRTIAGHILTGLGTRAAAPEIIIE
ncbi:MAG: P-loop NTPase, partial [Alphaproteobacteria bacterium]